ncbi:MAG: outer membrane protein assembly factor BamE [Betaproteobacteria bacterium]|jgi:outer membrane protein assembly factor BamE|nr:outer membrane protein assembly factor BamE [Betaproteobacteria bacterium]
MRSVLSLPSAFAAIVVVFALTACSFFAPYSIDVRQGNHIDEAMLAQLKPGMTREQVRFVLGSPLVIDVFHSDRWDYVYRFKSGRTGKTEQRAVSVFFANDKLDRVEGDTAPADGKEVTEPRARIIEVPRAKD